MRERGMKRAEKEERKIHGKEVGPTVIYTLSDLLSEDSPKLKPTSTY